MPYWLILPAFAATWIVIWSLKKRVEALSIAAPLQYVHQYELRFSKRLVDEVLKLAPEEYEHLKPAVENPIHLKIEFWRGHLVMFLTAEGKEQTPWPVYLRSSHYDKSPLKIWEKRFAEGEDNMFDIDPPVPTLRLSLTADSLELAAINGRFGRTDKFGAKPENIFMKLPMSRHELDDYDDYNDDDPDAHHYRPSNVREYKNHGKDEPMIWSLRIFDLDASGRYLS